MGRWVVLAVAGLLLAACGGGSSPPPTDTRVPPTAVARSAVDTTLGDARTVRVSLGAARVDSAGDRLARPPAHHEYVIIPVTFRNAGSGKGYYNDVAFRATDTRGGTYRSETLLPARDGGVIFLCCSLRPAEVRRGLLGFVVPAGTTSLSVSYAPGGMRPLHWTVAVP